jgi:hypothetical protein
MWNHVVINQELKLVTNANNIYREECKQKIDGTTTPTPSTSDQDCSLENRAEHCLNFFYGAEHVLDCLVVR